MNNVDTIKLVLVGGGGYALEMYSYIVDDLKLGYLRNVEIIGVLDDTNEPEVCVKNPTLKHLGAIKDYTFSGEEYALICVGSPVARKKLSELCTGLGLLPYTYVHSSCYVSSSAEIGQGVFVAPHSIISADSCIGDFVALNVFCGVGHGAKVGDFTCFSPYSVINGDCVVGTMVFLSSRVTVNPKVKIGSFSTIDGGAIVRSDVQDFEVVSQRVLEKRFVDRILKKIFSI